MNDFIKSISNNLTYRDGIWYSKNMTNISYPKNGNELCFQIEENSFWFRHRNKCIATVASKMAKENLLFDIGGGNGFTSLAMEAHKIKTVLVEPGINGVLNAKKRNLENIICSAFQDAGFKENSIPNIGIFDVLEHIKDDISFLNNINWALVKNGKLFITVPAFRFLWSAEDNYSGHYRRYTLRQLKSILKKANFRINYSTYFFTLLPIPIFLFRTIPSFLFRKKANISKKEKQHREGKWKKFISKIWDKEISLINKNKRIPFGGSCLIVATKDR